MKKSLLLFLCLMLNNCKDTKTDTKNQKNVPQYSDIQYGKLFFDYDQIEFYKIDIEEGGELICMTEKIFLNWIC